MNYNQYQIDETHREAIRQQAETRRIASHDANVLEVVRYQIGEALTNTGRKLQQRYDTQSNIPATATGTFYRVDPA